MMRWSANPRKGSGLCNCLKLAQAHFSNACQKSRENWAVKVLSLATYSFRMLLREHVSPARIAVVQGSSIVDSCIEDAVDKMRWHQHTHQIIFGWPSRREVQCVQSATKSQVGPSQIRKAYLGFVLLMCPMLVPNHKGQILAHPAGKQAHRQANC